MNRDQRVRAFAQRIGHTFAQPLLLRQALTHASAGRGACTDNGRLEFLGDRVLGLVVAEALFLQAPKAPEGQLAPRFNALVCKQTCAEIALEIALGEVLFLGKSEQTTGGRGKQAVLADAMEAVIAAVYLDAGHDAARGLVLRLWGARINDSGKTDARDSKSMLQQWAQARGLTPPVYDEACRTGPDHAPCFTIVARLGNGHEAVAHAGNKRQAERLAASALLRELGNDPPEK